MCGIFGFVADKNSSIDHKKLKRISDSLFKFSELRGKEAAGIAAFTDNEIRVYKEPASTSFL